MRLRADASELADLGSRLESVASRLQASLDAQIAASQPEVEAEGVKDLQIVTPIRTGALRESTVAQSAMEGNTLTTGIGQPALTKPYTVVTKDGEFTMTHYAGMPYAQWVIGGRGPVVPQLAKALWIPGWGWRTYASGHPGNPYPEESRYFLAPALEALGQKTARDAVSAALGAL